MFRGRGLGSGGLGVQVAEDLHRVMIEVGRRKERELFPVRISSQPPFYFCKIYIHICTYLYMSSIPTCLYLRLYLHLAISLSFYLCIYRSIYASAFYSVGAEGLGMSLY